MKIMKKVIICSNCGGFGEKPGITEKDKIHCTCHKCNGQGRLIEITEVKPNHPISFGAMGTHMITNWEMRVCDVLVAHNAEFDRSFLMSISGDYGTDQVNWICTYRCAFWFRLF